MRKLQLQSGACSRRSLLVALAAPGLLAACGGGGGGPAAAEPLRSTVLDGVAKQSVAAGLAGALYGHLYARGNTVVGVAGLRRLPSGGVLSEDDLFCVGSNGKAMTAVVAARVVEQGALRWDSRVLDVLPQAAPTAQAAYRGVTLEQLLNHRGGVWGMASEEDVVEFFQTLDQPLPGPLAQQRQLFARHLLSLAPRPGVVVGQTMLYSNAGYALAGIMLEAATGRSFEQLFETHITRGLDVPGRMGPPSSAGAGQPLGHRGEAGRLQPKPAYEGLEQVFVEVTAPAGNYSTTPQGFGRWLHAHLEALAGRPSPLPAGYVARLLAARAAESDYALGWGFQRVQGRQVLAHAGAEFGFFTLALMYANGQRAMFGMTNTEMAPWVSATLEEGLLKVEAVFN